MQLSIADIVGIVLMLCAAGSRLLPITEPWWSKLPDKLQPVIPALLLWLPQLMDLAGLATTKLDLVEMVMLTLAALTPGAHTRTRLGAKTPEVRASHRPPPGDDPPAGENPVGPPATKLPPNPRWGGPVAIVAVAVMGCGAGATPHAPPSSLPPGDPCRLETITAFAESCGADCDAKGGDTDACKDLCDAEIGRRCGQ